MNSVHDDPIPIIVFHETNRSNLAPFLCALSQRLEFPFGPHRLGFDRIERDDLESLVFLKLRLLKRKGFDLRPLFERRLGHQTAKGVRSAPTAKM